MEQKYEEAKKLLKKYNQQHVLSFYDNLSNEKKEKLLNQIENLDLEQIKKLYEKIKNPSNKNEEVKVTPIEYTDKSKLSKEEKERYKKIGEEELKKGTIAAVTMAGGQGTRLGHKGPKGTFDLGIGNKKKYLFEIICDTLKEVKEKYKVTVPWYIMTSEENNKVTQDFFEEQNYFGYPKEAITFFKQGQFPMIDTEGKILLNEEGIIKEAADGHGGVYIAMLKNNIMDDMRKRGVKKVVVGGIDNVLVKMFDPIFIGVFIDEGKPAASKSVIKSYPEEKVGVFCKKNGKPSIIEYTELSKEMANAVDKNGELIYGESNIIVHIFDLDIMEDISKKILPYHPAFKKANYMNEKGEIVVAKEPNAYKFEAFIFDAFGQLEDMSILRVKREEEFAPVKNASGVDSPETARKLYKNFHGIK